MTPQESAAPREAVVAALTTIAGTLDDLIRYHAALPEESAFAYVRVTQLVGMKAVADAALAAAPLPSDTPADGLDVACPHGHPGGHGCDLCSCVHPTVAASTPDALDVDRLARALRTQSPWKDDDAFLDVWANEAEAIAREYAALTQEPRP